MNTVSRLRLDAAATEFARLGAEPALAEVRLVMTDNPLNPGRT